MNALDPPSLDLASELDGERDSGPALELSPSDARSTLALQPRVPLYEDLVDAMDERTRTVLRREYVGRRGRREALVRRNLVISDVAAFALAWCLTALLTGLATPDAALPVLALFVVAQPLWIGLARGYGLYDTDVRQLSNTTVDELPRLVHLLVLGAVPTFIGLELGGVHPTPGAVGTFWALALPALTLGRASARMWMRRRLTHVQNAVIVGAGSVGQLVASKLSHGCRGINVVGFVDAAPRPLEQEHTEARFLGNLESLPTVVRLLDVERVIVAFSSDSSEELLALVRKLENVDAQIDIVPRLFDVLGPRVKLHELCGLPLMGLTPTRPSERALVVKRLVDTAASAVLLTFLAPLLALIAVSVKVSSPGPVFYKGRRIGRNGREFRLLKFRTMRLEHCRGPEYGGDDAEVTYRALMSDQATRQEFERAHKFAQDPRVTHLGAFLRRTSLDELPQLLNVISGDVALVGPRPITGEEYDDLVTASAGANESPDSAGGYWTVPDLRPGVTGYWQINGRSSTSYEERVRLDSAYATSRSLRLDLRILAKTGSALLDGRNAH